MMVAQRAIFMDRQIAVELSNELTVDGRVMATISWN